MKIKLRILDEETAFLDFKQRFQILIVLVYIVYASVQLVLSFYQDGKGGISLLRGRVYFLFEATKDHLDKGTEFIRRISSPAKPLLK